MISIIGGNGNDWYIWLKNDMDTYSNTIDGGNQTVAEIATSHPGALSVFMKYNIDYCCGGNRSLEEACLRMGLHPDRVRAEIFNATGEEFSVPSRAEQWTIALLTEYIVQNHHAYVRHVIPEITALLEKLCTAHGEDSIELMNIQQDFEDLADELLHHMDKEEVALFPAMKRLEMHNDSTHPLLNTLKGPISMIEQEHRSAGDLMKSIRKLSRNYTVPEFACPTYRIAYQKLKAFDSDLMTHVHLENNILFKKAERH